MSYSYKDLREKVFTDEGQRMFLSIRDRATHMLNDAGAFMLGNVIAKQSGDSWLMLACVDRLVELEEIREIHRAQRSRAGSSLRTHAV